MSMRIVLVMGVPAFAGAFVGGFGSGRVPDSLLILLAGLLVFWQGIELVGRARTQSRGAPSNDLGDSASLPAATGIFSRNRVLAEAGVGLAVGLLGGAVGLILGSIRLPALIRILRVEPSHSGGHQPFHRLHHGLGGLGRPRGPGPGGLSTAGAHGRRRNGGKLLRRQAPAPGESA